MAQGDARSLRARLTGAGLSDSALNAAWPRWWSDEADSSVSARVDLRFSLARNLGLDPRSLLLDDQAPRFVWKDEARFKRLTDAGASEREVITSFGRALGGLVLAATPPAVAGLFRPLPAAQLRAALLGGGAPYVTLVDLLSLCWSLGIPVIHLRVFPWRQKRMAAMTVRVGDRFAILFGKDSQYPAPIAFYLAHELGHIFLEHLAQEPVLVDVDEEGIITTGGDPEEAAADEYGLEVLTGEPRPQILPGDRHVSGPALAAAALNAAQELRIEPGTLALCFGYTTSRWGTANGAMRYIYARPASVWAEVNGLAQSQLRFDNLGEDAADYLRAVLGN